MHKTKPWNVKDHLRTEEDIKAYLVAVREIGDARLSVLAENDAREARIAIWITKAKSCHTGNSARGNAMKDEA